MTEENASGGQCRARHALGDVTNRIGTRTRGFSGREKGGFNERDAVKRLCVSPRPCSEINYLKGNDISSFSKIPTENGDSNVIGSLKSHAGYDKGNILDLRGGNFGSRSVNEMDVVDNDSRDRCSKTELSKISIANVDEVAGQIRKNFNRTNLEGGKVSDSIGNGTDYCTLFDLIKESKCSSLDFDMFETFHSVNTEAYNNQGNHSPADTPRSLSRTGNDFPHHGQRCDVGEQIISHEGTQSDIIDHHNDLDDHIEENLVLSQPGSVDCDFLLQSQEARVCGIDKSSEPKEGKCAHMTVETGAVKECSCSLCTKAAYIWLDLQQQDINARLSVLKRSQKVAGILAERSSRIKMNETNGVESINRASKLESHLMYQWRSLFLHMSKIWEAESNKLEASLLPLNNLRDKCKDGMELLNVKQLEKH